MASKAKAVAALKKHCKDAELHDCDPPSGFQVELVAPHGHHWEHDVHCRCCNYWSNSVPKTEYWDYVIAEIENLPPAVKCVDSDCEGIADFGICEFWEEE